MTSTLILGLSLTTRSTGLSAVILSPISRMSSRQWKNFTASSDAEECWKLSHRISAPTMHLQTSPAAGFLVLGAWIVFALIGISSIDIAEPNLSYLKCESRFFKPKYLSGIDASSTRFAWLELRR